MQFFALILEIPALGPECRCEALGTSDKTVADEATGR